jgi:hypothetical protein
MSTPRPRNPQPSFRENLLLAAVGLLAHGPLCYQLPRWASGLDPTFVHPNWLEHPELPLPLILLTIHPLLWIGVIVLVFIRLCRNFGWRLESWPAPDRFIDRSLNLKPRLSEL